MLKYILLFLITFFIVSCSDSSTRNNAEYLSISKSPSSSEPISVFQQFYLEFTLPIDSISISNSSIYLEADYGEGLSLVDVAFELSKDGRRIVIVPQMYLDNSRSYNFTVTTDIKSLDGKSLSENYTYSFTTLSDGTNDYQALKFTGIRPGDGTNGISTFTDISIGFDKPIVPESMPLVNVKVNGEAISGKIEYLNSVLTFIPSSRLSDDTNYTVELVQAPTDMYGNNYNMNTTQWMFTTIELASDAFINEGFSILGSLNLNKQSSKIIPMYSTGFSKYIVSHEKSFSVLTLNRDNVISSLELTERVEIPSKITDTLSIYYNSRLYLLVATYDQGIYLYEDTNTTGLTYLSKTEPSLPIHSLTYLDANVYAVGPTYGIEHFSLSSGENLVSLHKDANVSGITPLYAFALGTPLKLWVSDYDNGVRIYDENITFMSKIDINGSSKKFVYNYNSQKLEIENAIGSMYEIDKSTNSLTTSVTEFMSSLISTSPTLDFGLDYLFERYGLMVVDLNTSTVNFLQQNTQTVSSSLYVESGKYSLKFLLDGDGKIDTFNGVKDILAPGIFSVIAGADITTIRITFDEYIEATSININDITVKDTSLNIIPINNFVFTGFRVEVDANLINGDDYNITILPGTSDYVGNKTTNELNLIFTSSGQ